MLSSFLLHSIGFLLLCVTKSRLVSAFLPISNPFLKTRQVFHFVDCFEKPKWLEEAMESENFPSSPEDVGNSRPKLEPGLSGFCLDPELGFVAILTSDEKFVATTVSHKDKGRDSLVSPEALICIQLAGGLDLGTAILPPDALVRIAFTELLDDGEDEILSNPPLVSLTGVRVVPNDNYNKSNLHGAKENDRKGFTSTESSSGRKEAIQHGLPQVVKAVQSLAGLQDVNFKQVEEAMSIYANENGSLDRQGFSNVLDRLRQELSFCPAEANKLKFVLDVNVVCEDSINSLSVETLDSFQAIGLAMRHNTHIQVASECLEDDVKEILVRFPAFRPMQELWEDAKVMDSFIPSMFEEAMRQQPPSPY